jgi:hypothetical protein
MLLNSLSKTTPRNRANGCRRRLLNGFNDIIIALKWRRLQYEFAMKTRHILILLTFILALGFTARAENSSTNLGHPRLYCTAGEILRLREAHDDLHVRILSNVVQSADWCLTKTPRPSWIAPVTPDPIYENLYDRFYGIMGDMAIMEHLSFAYALTGNPEYGEAARKWVLNSCRIWQREADAVPDSGTGYAVSRLLKGVAVGYDLAYDRFSDAERKEIRDTLARIGGMYYEKYFNTADRFSGTNFYTHHATVEWSSFGVMALTLLGEVPQAQTWVDTTVKKFEQQLLPRGLAADGAQVEGATFWASTMQYRIFFMDALRRVTGRDLFQPFKREMNADLALASIATIQTPGYNQDEDNVVLEPYYGQLNYYSPVLLSLAREYHRPIFQYLALWDHSLGQLQKTRAITPHGVQLLLDLGPYAYFWCDPSVPARADESKFSYLFSSVNQAYLRESWRPSDLVVGVDNGQIVVHAGGQCVLAEVGLKHELPPELRAPSIEDNGSIAVIRCGQSPTNRLIIELDRPEHKLTIRRNVGSNWEWWCQGPAIRQGNELHWGDRASLRVLKGEITQFDAVGHAPTLVTGLGKLNLTDPAPMKFPLTSARAKSGHEIVIEIRCSPPEAKTP